MSRRRMAHAVGTLRIAVDGRLHSEHAVKGVFVSVARHIPIVGMDQERRARSIAQGIDGYDVIKMPVGQKDHLQGASRLCDGVQNGLCLCAGIDHCGVRARGEQIAV